MFVGNLTDSEALELYRHLLKALEDRSLHELAREIEDSASAPIFVEEHGDAAAQLTKRFKGEVGVSLVRPPEPCEVLSSALDSIWTRMVELPAVSDAVLMRFGESVEFRADLHEGYSPARSKPFVMSDLGLDRDQRAEIHDAFQALEFVPRWKDGE